MPQNSYGQTAVLIACKYRQQEMAKLFLKAGSNSNIADHNGNTSLHAAVYGNFSKNVVQTIINHGASVNTTDNKNTSPLMLASKKGNVDVMKVLLRAGADQNIEDENGNSWIHYAVREDCRKVLQSIVDKGADVNGTNKKNITPLMLASVKGNIDAVNVLLRAGADQTIEDANGYTWIHYAVVGDCRKDVLQSIVDLGAKVNAKTKQYTTALMLASSKGNIDAINILLSAGADHAIADADGDSCIHYAVRGDCRKEVLQSIVDKGADVNATNNKNITPLMLASTKGNVDAVNLLLSAGADQTIEDDTGYTWIHYAVFGDCRKEVLQSIVDLGAKVNAKTKQNTTALMLASRKGNIDAINVLLSAQGVQAIEDINGNSWIHYAVLGDCSKEVLQSIIDQGADVNATNKQNATPLMLASKKGNVDVMNVLLSAGANMALKSMCGNTWIHYAIHGDCSKEVLQSIIDFGADVNATNTENCSVLMLASKKGNVDAMNVLLRAGANMALKNINGDTWIHHAVNGDCSKEVLKLIIDQGTDVNATNKENCSALMLASKKGNVDVMNVLLREGADQATEDSFGFSWIHYAVLGDCRKEVIQSVLDHGADVNTTSKKNVTPLMLAGEKGNVDAMAVLINAGANKEIKNFFGLTWVHYVIHGDCSKEVLHSIIDLGADVNATNKRNISVLMMASKKGNTDTVNVLLRAGADPAIEDTNGYLCIHYAIDGDCSKEALQSIIDHCADVNVTSKTNETPLM